MREELLGELPELSIIATLVVSPEIAGVDHHKMLE